MRDQQTKIHYLAISKHAPSSRAKIQDKIIDRFDSKEMIARDFLAKPCDLKETNNSV